MYNMGHGSPTGWSLISCLGNAPEFGPALSWCWRGGRTYSVAGIVSVPTSPRAPEQWQIGTCFPPRKQVGFRQDSKCIHSP